ncbi:hypothetical protein Tco_0704129 [Tanacetum coccineum]|uniref:Uncharacterized protein n=1 Tax=Tanacetum coccineum TaxID=301880 RepID=A0ABQ4Y2H1_9ASTR
MKSLSGRMNLRESNIGDSDNIRNGGKTAGRAIITWGGGIASLISKSEGTIVEEITVVILVRDRCPRGKGLEGDEEKLYDEYEGLWRLGKVSNIPIGSSISLEGFFSFMLLLGVIIVMVVIVAVILVVVVIVIVGVVIVVVFGIIVVVVPLVPVFLLGLLALAIDVACAFRAEEMPSLISCQMAAKVMDGVSDVDILLGGILST